jgi:hypothetical protein
MPIEEATQDKPQVNLVTGDKLGLPPPPGFMGVGR